MTAKSFCYACAGIFLLVAACTMGGSNGVVGTRSEDTSAGRLSSL